jgi:hypothetical protein
MSLPDSSRFRAGFSRHGAVQVVMGHQEVEQRCLVADVLGQDDEAERVLDEVARCVTKLVALDLALVVPRAEVVRADAVPDDGHVEALVLPADRRRTDAELRLVADEDYVLDTLRPEVGVEVGVVEAE